MPPWLFALLAVGVLAGLFAGIFFLVRQAQRGDSYERGRDSAPPEGFNPIYAADFHDPLKE